MIHRIYSSLPTFKNLKFNAGLNVLLAEKSVGATSLQTRNRAGKTSLIEIIHFLTGANKEKKSLFTATALKNITFGIAFDLAGKPVTIERQNLDRASFNLDKSPISAVNWKAKLGHEMFGLREEWENEGSTPKFRSLFAYFARRVLSGAFYSPDKQTAKMQGADVSQMALMYLFGLDWRIAADWKLVRDKEKTLKELKKAVKAGAFERFIGNAAELRTQLTVAEDDLQRRKTELDMFRVLPQYHEMEKEADAITHQLNELANANTIELAAIRDFKLALETEAPPELIDLDSVYNEAGIALPGLVKKRYDDVRGFHESVVRNRRDYLSSELEEAKSRIEKRNQQKIKLDERRAQIMGILKSYGALEQFTQLQAEVSRLESAVETLRHRYESAENLEGTKSELEIERNRLLQRLRLNFKEQKNQLDQAILAYQQISSALYEEAGSIYVDETSNGPTFRFEIQGSRSVGIKNMQIFCFDIMLMRLCSQMGIGPGFLIHDSHLFDGVDGRQVIRALRVGAAVAKELGFQYIVTINEDDAFKEKESGFDLRDYCLDVKLTDATEDGGLFGIRFD